MSWLDIALLVVLPKVILLGLCFVVFVMNRRLQDALKLHREALRLHAGALALVRLLVEKPEGPAP